jgi:hypothetical protein
MMKKIRFYSTISKNTVKNRIMKTAIREFKKNIRLHIIPSTLREYYMARKVRNSLNSSSGTVTILKFLI